MKFILILFVLFSSSYVLSKDELVKCKRLSSNDKDDGDVFHVLVILNNATENEKASKNEKFCPLIIKTRDKVASNCDNCYLNLSKDDTGPFVGFPCKYLGEDIELKCKKDK